MAMCTCTETPFKTPAKDKWGGREQNRHKSTPSNIFGEDGIRVIRGTTDGNTAKDMVKSRGRETSFRTMDKYGRKKVSFQDTEHEVNKATSISFKTIDKSDTKQVSFKTIEETNNKSIPFKTFDDLVKARTANCDTALKDALSLVSDKKSALDRRTHNEQDLHNWRDPIPAIQSQTAGGQTAPVTPAAQGDPHGQRRDPHGVKKKRVHHRAHENPAAQGDPHGQRRDPMEHRRGEFTMVPRRMFPVQPRQRQKSHNYSSTTSLYNTDRTAGIKATSSVATQTDCFQDPWRGKLVN